MVRTILGLIGRLGVMNPQQQQHQQTINPYLKSLGITGAVGGNAVASGSTSGFGPGLAATSGGPSLYRSNAGGIYGQSGGVAIGNGGWRGQLFGGTSSGSPALAPFGGFPGMGQGTASNAAPSSSMYFSSTPPGHSYLMNYGAPGSNSGSPFSHALRPNSNVGPGGPMKPQNGHMGIVHGHMLGSGHASGSNLQAYSGSGLMGSPIGAMLALPSQQQSSGGGSGGPSHASSHNASRNYNQPHQHAKLARFNPDGPGGDKLASEVAKDQTASSAQKEEEGEWTGLDIGGMAIRNISLSLYQSFRFLTKLYLNHNQITTISPQIGNLVELRVLHLSSNRIKALPSEIGRLIKLTELLLYDNLLTGLPFEFGNLYKLESLGLDGNPWHDPIYSLMQKDATCLSVVPFLRDHAPLNASPPPERHWIPLDSDTPALDSFTVMSYNILCNHYADPSSYGYVPSWALAWDYRKDLILGEIAQSLPDILCLQELDKGEFEDSVLFALKDLGYAGCFFSKGRADTMDDENQRKMVDGCSIFFKVDKFQVVSRNFETLLQEDQVDECNLAVEAASVFKFSQLLMNHKVMPRGDDILNRAMNRDNIGVLLPLRHIKSSKVIFVVNTHLHWDPEYKDVKLLQALMLVESIHAKREEYAVQLEKHGHPGPIEVIMMGDFNSLPDSGVYDLIVDGRLQKNHPDFQGFNYEPFSSEGGNLNPIKFKDAYDSRPATLTSSSRSAESGDADSQKMVVSTGTCTPQTTTFTSSNSSSSKAFAGKNFTIFSYDFAGIIDYIFYTPFSAHPSNATTRHSSGGASRSNPGGLVLSAILSLLPREYFSKIVGLPSPHIPSDHLPLMAEFKIPVDK